MYHVREGGACAARLCQALSAANWPADSSRVTPFRCYTSALGWYHRQHDVGWAIGIVIDRLAGGLELSGQADVIFVGVGISQVVWVVAARNLDADAMAA